MYVQIFLIASLSENEFMDDADNKESILSLLCVESKLPKNSHSFTDNHDPY